MMGFIFYLLFFFYSGVESALCDGYFNCFNCFGYFDYFDYLATSTAWLGGSSRGYCFLLDLVQAARVQGLPGDERLGILATQLHLGHQLLMALLDVLQTRRMDGSALAQQVVALANLLALFLGQYLGEAISQGIAGSAALEAIHSNSGLSGDELPCGQSFGLLGHLLTRRGNQELGHQGM